MVLTFLFLGMGPQEIFVLVVLGLILFGRRLPEVGRSLGKSFVQFKAGLQDMQAELKEMDRMTDAAARQDILKKNSETNDAGIPRDDSEPEASDDVATETNAAEMAADEHQDRREPEA
ncbi:MAG TPA: twin-arginine translocase TatA/TatE family subunit [Planctomycetes bacterium]|nr:twin-arginine translocase TatA/TatE family subunit [Planctomycetota bacterium]